MYPRTVATEPFWAARAWATVSGAATVVAEAEVGAGTACAGGRGTTAARAASIAKRIVEIAGAARTRCIPRGCCTENSVRTLAGASR